jgi:hypothetical protein
LTLIWTFGAGIKNEQKFMEKTCLTGFNGILMDHLFFQSIFYGFFTTGGQIVFYDTSDCTETGRLLENSKKKSFV